VTLISNSVQQAYTTSHKGRIIRCNNVRFVRVHMHEHRPAWVKVMQNHARRKNQLSPVVQAGYLQASCCILLLLGRQQRVRVCEMPVVSGWGDIIDMAKAAFTHFAQILMHNSSFCLQIMSSLKSSRRADSLSKPTSGPLDTKVAFNVSPWQKHITQFTYS